jgi:hypothetical protein
MASFDDITPPEPVDEAAARLERLLEEARAAGFEPDPSDDRLEPSATPTPAAPSFRPTTLGSPVVPNQFAPRGSLVAELRREIASIDFRAAPSDDPADLGEVITKARSVARRLVNIVLSGANRDSVEAARLLFAYAEGLPVQPIEFDVARVVTELASDRGLSQEDINRAVSETKRIITQAKAGTTT